MTKKEYDHNYYLNNKNKRVAINSENVRSGKNKKYLHNYYLNNKDTFEFKEKRRKYCRRLLNKVLDYYGHQCSICENTERLCVDHIDGKNIDGKHRIGKGLWVWIIKNNFPEGFRILCKKCNTLDGFLRKHTRLGINGIDTLLQLQKELSL